MIRYYLVIFFIGVSTFLLANNQLEVCDSLKPTYNQSVLDPLVTNYSSVFVTKKGIEGYGFLDNRAGLINIRGVGQGRRVALFRDGVPMNIQLDGIHLGEIINSAYVENVSLVKGSNSLLYGKNGLAGVVNISSIIDTTEGKGANALVGYGSYNTQIYNLNSRYNRDKFISNISLNYKSSNGHRSNSDFSRLDIYLRTVYDLNENINIRVNGSYTDLFSRNPGVITTPLLKSMSDLDFATLSFGLNNKFDKASGELILYTTLYRNTINNGFVPSDFPTDYQSIFKESAFGVRANESFLLNNGSTISVGLDYSYNSGSILRDYFKNTENNIEILNDDITELSVYALWEHKFFNFFSLEAGVRYTNNSSFKNEFTPQLAFTIDNSRYKFRGGISKGYRSPSLMELYFGSASNPDLLQESGVTYETSFEAWFLDNKLWSKATLFYLDMWNVVEQKRIMGMPKNLNTGFLESKGFEFDIKYFFNDEWRFIGNYSYASLSPLTIHAPESIINFEVLYSKFPFDASVTYSNARDYCINIFTKQKNSYSLVDIKGFYHTKLYGYRSSFFVMCDNLLGSSYSIIQGFRMPGVTFFLGFELKL